MGLMNGKLRDTSTWSVKQASKNAKPIKTMANGLVPAILARE